MKKTICLIIAVVQLMFCVVNTSYAQDVITVEAFEVSASEKCDLKCEGILYEEIEKPEIYDISVFSNQTYTFEETYEYMYEILKSHDTDTFMNSSGQMVIDLYSKGHRLNEAQFNAMAKRLLCENGELFLSRVYGVATVVSPEDNTTYADVMAFRYYIDADKIDETLTEFDESLEPFISSINTPKLSDLEKTLLVHDYINRNTRYIFDDEVMEVDYKHSMYGFFTYGICVCQGYTEAMCYILDKLGIECVSCLCDAIEHVWNCVKIDDKWYHVDATWNDTYDVRTGDINTITVDSMDYKYFLNGIDDVLAYKECSAQDLVYPSGKLQNADCANYDYDSGYIFNDYSPTVLNVSSDESVIYDKIENKGFYYNNGRIANDVVTEGYLMPTQLTYEFDGLKIMDMAITKPTKASDGYYYFLTRVMNGENTQTGIDMYMSSKDSDGTQSIESISTLIRLAFGNYKMVGIKDAALISTIDNAESAEFFVWNEQQSPLSYKIRK